EVGVFTAFAGPPVSGRALDRKNEMAERADDPDSRERQHPAPAAQPPPDDATREGADRECRLEARRTGRDPEPSAALQFEADATGDAVREEVSADSREHHEAQPAIVRHEVT